MKTKPFRGGPSYAGVRYCPRCGLMQDRTDPDPSTCPRCAPSDEVDA